MKKYFIFAALVTAGMLTSCSSSDDIAVNDSPVPTIEDVNDRVPIVVGLSTTATTETRGTGTVGSTDAAGAPAHAWNSQKINVFMFNKGTLDLAMDNDPDNPTQTAPIYDNTVMTAPNGTDPDGTGPLTESYGLATELVGANPTQDAAGDETHIRHRYYPMGAAKFDFWGYHADDAATGTAAAPYNISANAITVPFKIDGSQDLMTAKAEPTISYANLDASLKGTGNKWPAESDFNAALYSNSTARQNVHPNLKFQHLLTRFHFQIRGGNAQSAGWEDNTTPPTAGDTYSGVFVKSVQIESKTTGELVAAYIDETPYKTLAALDLEKLTESWDESELLTLKGTERYAADVPAVAQVLYEAGDLATANAGKTDAVITATNKSIADIVADNADMTAAQATAVNTLLALTGTDVYAEHGTLTTAHATAYAAAKGYVFEGDVRTPAQPAKRKGDLKPLYDFDITTADLTITTATDDHWSKIVRPTSSSNTNYTAQYTDFGSALMVKPGEASYRIKIVLGQYLLDREEINPANPAAPADTYIIKEFTLDSDNHDISELTPPSSATKFEAGNSYNVRITVYGAEEIKIYTTLTKWHEADPVDIDMD